MYELRAVISVTDLSYSALLARSSDEVQSSPSIAERRPRNERSTPERYAAPQRMTTARIKRRIFFIQIKKS